MFKWVAWTFPGVKVCSTRMQSHAFYIFSCLSPNIKNWQVGYFGIVFKWQIKCYLCHCELIADLHMNNKVPVHKGANHVPKAVLDRDSDPFLIWKPDFTLCERKALSNQAFEMQKNRASWIMIHLESLIRRTCECKTLSERDSCACILEMCAEAMHGSISAVGSGSWSETAFGTWFAPLWTGPLCTLWQWVDDIRLTKFNFRHWIRLMIQD